MTRNKTENKTFCTIKRINKIENAKRMRNRRRSVQSNDNESVKVDSILWLKHFKKIDTRIM